MTRSSLPYRGADFALTVDGVDYTPGTRQRLSNLTLTEHRSGQADELSLSLSDPDGRLALPARGGLITLQLGWRTMASGTRAMVDKGSFHVDEVEYDDGEGLIEVKARSADLTGALRLRTERSWTETTLGAVLSDLAAGAGLQLRAEAGLAAMQIPVLAQSRESDAAFLTRLGRQYDAVATVKTGRLIFTPKSSGANAAGDALPMTTLQRCDGDRLRLTLAQREKYTGVSVAWHDQDGAVRKTVNAGAAGSRKRVRRIYANSSDAKAAADAEWARTQRAGGSVALNLALGRPEIYPEQKLRLAGYTKPEITDPTWLVDTSTHTLGADEGLSSALQLEPAS